MKTLTDKVNALKSQKFTGSLVLEFREGHVIETSKLFATVSMEDQIAGLLTVMSANPDAEIRITWVSGIIRHVEVVSESEAADPPTNLGYQFQMQALRGFHGTTVVEQRGGQVVRCENHAMWKAERAGEVLRVLREKLG